MSKIEVDTIDTQSSTTLQVGSTNTALNKIGTSGDTVEYPAGTTFTQSGTQNVTAGGAINVKSGGNITIDSGATITNNGTATGFSADLTNLNATNLTSGTVPNARFPATLPIANGSALTNLNATNLGSGTIPDARFPAALPAISGAALTNLPGGGKVLQVVSDTLTAEYTTGSTSFSDTGLTLNITPSATSSKILILMQGTAYSNTAGTRFILTVLRDSTNLATGDSSGDYGFYGLKILGASQNISGSSIILLDSPSSTSSLTYKVQGRLDTASGAGQLSINATTSTLIAMEIGA